MHDISEEIRIVFKDRLRKIRHIVRQHRHDSKLSPYRQSSQRFNLPFLPFAHNAEILLGHAVSTFDDAMSLAETLIPVDRSVQTQGAVARSFMACFATGPDVARAFRHDFYYLTRAVFAQRGLTNILIRETELASVHAAMRKHHSLLLDALANNHTWSENIAVTSALCATLLRLLLNHRPLHFSEHHSKITIGLTLEVSCLAPVILVLAIATLEQLQENKKVRSSAMDKKDLVDLACFAVEPYLARIEAACSASEGQKDLTRLFALLLTHTP